MTPLQRFLERHPDAKKRGDQYVMKCRAHKDSRASLYVRERQDGALLICCRAACSAVDVVMAAGLELHDLFPPRTERIDHRCRGERLPYVGADVIAALGYELLIVAILARDVATGGPIDRQTRDRAHLAAMRLLRGFDMAFPQRDRRREFREALGIAASDLFEEAA